MDFFTLVFYSAGVVVIAVPVTCYAYYLYTKCCPGRQPPAVASKPAPAGPKRLICRRIACGSQAEAEQKARKYSAGRDPVLDGPHLNSSHPLNSYHYHLANRAKCMVRGRLYSYTFLFPGPIALTDQLMLEQRSERKKALLQIARHNGLSSVMSDHELGTDALFENDSDYELIDDDDNDSLDDIQYLDL